MNPDKNKSDANDQPVKKSPDAVETPPPPQHIDPSKIPLTDKEESKSKKSGKKEGGK